MILDMIYNVGSILEQFYKEPIIPNIFLIFPSWLYYSLRDPEIHVLWNLKTSGVVFTTVKLIYLFIFLIFKYSKILYTQKKHAPILFNIKNQIC